MLPETVENTMQRLCQFINQKTEITDATYIYGSIALGDYIEGSSDIDFITILRYIPSAIEIDFIKNAHLQVENELPETDMMGAYLLSADLGKSKTELSFLMTYYDKKLHFDGKGADINPITWSILKSDGIRFYGRSTPFNYEVNLDELKNYVKGNLNHYWHNWIKRLEAQRDNPTTTLCEQETIKQLDEAVEWCTLGMLRQLFTIKEHGIVSKVKAGHYGLQTLPSEWHSLILEAINIKMLLPDRYYVSQNERLVDLIQLLRFIHTEGNL